MAFDDARSHSFCPAYLRYGGSGGHNSFLTCVKGHKPDGWPRGASDVFGTSFPAPSSCISLGQAAYPPARGDHDTDSCGEIYVRAHTTRRVYQRKATPSRIAI